MLVLLFCKQTAGPECCFQTSLNSGMSPCHTSTISCYPPVIPSSGVIPFTTIISCYPHTPSSVVTHYTSIISCYFLYHHHQLLTNIPHHQLLLPLQYPIISYCYPPPIPQSSCCYHPLHLHCLVVTPLYPIPHWMKHGYQLACGAMRMKGGALKTCTAVSSFHFKLTVILNTVAKTFLCCSHLRKFIVSRSVNRL